MGRRISPPLSARTRAMHRSVEPAAYDRVRLVATRDGTAIAFSEFGQKPVSTGYVVFLGANGLFGLEPEGHVTCTTIYTDTDPALDQFFWQYATFLHDRLDAQDMAEKIYAEPAQLLHIGRDKAGLLMPWLDELVRLSAAGKYHACFHPRHPAQRPRSSEDSGDDDTITAKPKQMIWPQTPAVATKKPCPAMTRGKVRMFYFTWYPVEPIDRKSVV